MAGLVQTGRENVGQAYGGTALDRRMSEAGLRPMGGAPVQPAAREPVPSPVTPPQPKVDTSSIWGAQNLPEQEQRYMTSAQMMYGYNPRNPNMAMPNIRDALEYTEGRVSPEAIGQMYADQWSPQARQARMGNR